MSFTAQDGFGLGPYSRGIPSGMQSAYRHHVLVCHLQNPSSLKATFPRPRGDGFGILSGKTLGTTTAQISPQRRGQAWLSAIPSHSC